MNKGKFPGSKGSRLVLIFLIITLLITSVAYSALADGPGGGGSGGGSSSEGSGGVSGGSGEGSGGDGGGSGGGGESHTWRHQFRHQINQSIENGTLVMETTFTWRNRHIVQENNHYQYGMELELDGATSKRIRIRVRAEFQEGKLIVLNVEQNVLNLGESGNCNIHFDGQKMQQGTLEEILEGNSSQAMYVGAFGEGGAQFLVYIPHFSEHIIEIESLVPLVEEVLFTQSNYVVMGLGILALIGLSGYVYKVGKSKF